MPMDRSDGLHSLPTLQDWSADLSSRFSPKVARQIVTVVCLVYQAFATWKRRAPFTEAQVRRRLAALQHIEHRALSECDVSMYATFVSSFELRSLPPKSPLWKFLGIRSMPAQTQRWPVIRFEHKSIEWHARWNPARRLLISGEGQSQVLYAMELPDVRSIFPDLPKTTRDERIERSTPKELCINAYTANPLKNFRSILAYAAHLQKISIDISTASINMDALSGSEFPNSKSFACEILVGVFHEQDNWHLLTNLLASVCSQASSRRQSWVIFWPVCLTRLGGSVLSH